MFLYILFGNNIDVVQSIVCHVERSEPLGRRPVGERQTSRWVSWRKLLGEAKASFVATDAFIPRRPCARFFRRYALSEPLGRWKQWHSTRGERIYGQLLYYLLLFLVDTQALLSGNFWISVKIEHPPIPRNGGVGRKQIIFQHITPNYRHPQPKKGKHYFYKLLYCCSIKSFLLRRISFVPIP